MATERIPIPSRMKSITLLSADIDAQMCPRSRTMGFSSDCCELLPEPEAADLQLDELRGDAVDPVGLEAPLFGRGLAGGPELLWPLEHLRALHGAVSPDHHAHGDRALDSTRLGRRRVFGRRIADHHRRRH